MAGARHVLRAEAPLGLAPDGAAAGDLIEEGVYAVEGKRGFAEVWSTAQTVGAFAEASLQFHIKVERTGRDAERWDGLPQVVVIGRGFLEVGGHLGARINRRALLGLLGCFGLLGSG